MRKNNIFKIVFAFFVSSCGGGGHDDSNIDPQKPTEHCTQGGAPYKVCRLMPLPQTSSTLKGIWGSSRNDIWAVGNTGTLLHYDGENWAVQNSFTQNDLNGIWGSQSKDIWAIGTKGTLFHYQGDTWSAVPLATNRDLNGIFGRSGNDIWVVGNNLTILHFDGTEWRQVLSGNDVARDFYAVWSSGPTDIWAVGGFGTAFHGDGTTWRPVITPFGAEIAIDAILGDAPNHVWAVGDFNATIIHFDGTNWTKDPTPITQLHRMITMWGSSNDTWVAGFGGWVVHFNGKDWFPIPTSTDADIHAGWSDNKGEGWMVGTRGTLLHIYPSS